MAQIDRRNFLRTTGMGAAASAALNFSTATSRAAGANERVVLGVIGCGGRARKDLLKEFQGDLVEIAYVCDADSKGAHQAALQVQARGGAVKTVSDMRRVFDDRSVDAVVVATPDHWHAPAAIMACDAGKHVYVEKPCSHNLREGRLLVDAARRNKRVVQHGTQSRSMPLIADSIGMLREGIIGDVLVAKAWNVQLRDDIGHAAPSKPPAWLDYDLWVGPAEFVPHQANRLHYNWHWWHNFGTGDMGNEGVHELDYARWGLGIETHPTRISGLGGKLFFQDDQQFPDTQQIVFEYAGEGNDAANSGLSATASLREERQRGELAAADADRPPRDKRMLIWEMRIWSTNYPYNVDNGVEFYGTKGRMLLTKRGKVEVFGQDNKRIQAELKSKQAALLPHQLEFLDAVRNDRKPNADIEIGHLSTSLCHLGNIATRVGRTLEFDPQSEQILGDEAANRMLTRAYRKGGHWAIPV
jgi:predicted dehydrogenase